MKGKNGKKKVKRVAVNCIYRALYRSREFTVLGNFEAFNLLKNKLDKMALAHQPGKLIFEFVPGELPKGSSPSYRSMSPFLTRENINSQICVCGHSRYAHSGPEKCYPYRDACQVKRVKDCGCRKYQKKR